MCPTHVARVARIVSLFAAAAFLSLGPGAAPVIAQDDHTVLYFGMKKTATSDYDLYMADPDPDKPNIRLVPMVDRAGDQHSPAVSPNGRHLLYFNNGDLWVLDHSTEMTRELISLAYPEDWHPLENRFLYRNYKYCDEGIYEAFFDIDPEGEITISSTRLIYHLVDYPSASARYSPNGHEIVFSHATSYCGGGYNHAEIFIASLEAPMPLQFADLCRVTNNDASAIWDWDTVWSTDGQRIFWGRESVGILWVDVTDPNLCAGPTENTLITLEGPQVYAPMASPPASYPGKFVLATFDYPQNEIALVDSLGLKETMDLGECNSVVGIAWGRDSNPYFLKPELLAEVPPAGGFNLTHIEAIEVRDSQPNEIVFATPNEGRQCGGGTPVSMWKLTLDPETGNIIELELKQHLTLIQLVREALHEAPDGTLLTGSGWCGYKPPYYSMDGGETWHTATTGIHPPNSTFTYVTFNGEVFAGTGYEPWPAEIYRWLGTGGPDNWELVFRASPTPLAFISFAVFEGELFGGSWPVGGCNGAGVYVSSDGNSFSATSGMDPCSWVRKLLVLDDQLIALEWSDPNIHVYRWNKLSRQWKDIGVVPLNSFYPENSGSVAANGAIYAHGQRNDGSSYGIQRSIDLGLSWRQIAEIDGPNATAIHLHDNALYVGTGKDPNTNNSAFIYRLPLRPTLSIPLHAPAVADEPVTVPVTFVANGSDVSVTAFSVDYDSSCLHFDPTDQDGDKIPDSVAFEVPAGFVTTVGFDPADVDGELDILIGDFPPTLTLDNGVVATVTFTPTCTPPTGGSVEVPVAFSVDPAPSFGNTAGQSVPGDSLDGTVVILYDNPGDCNGDGMVDAGDFAACGLEIFDGDGSFWLDTPGGTFAGNPVGCDANASTLITAADVTCTQSLIFGGDCSGSVEAARASVPTILTVTGTTPGAPGGLSWIRVEMEPGFAIGALALSLDLDPAVFDVGGIDADSDGLPDNIRYPNGKPGMAMVRFDLEDADGELDLLLADLSFTPLAKGVLVEIGVPVIGSGKPTAGLSISAAPSESFGTVDGADVAGQAVVVEADVIFANGFESGDCSAWSVCPVH